MEARISLSNVSQKYSFCAYAVFGKIALYDGTPVFSVVRIATETLQLPCMMYVPGGGGGTFICMHIGYVPRERPPFSALNFRSGAYFIFTIYKKNPFRSITVLHFHARPGARSGALAHFTLPRHIPTKIWGEYLPPPPPPGGGGGGM